MAGTDTADSGSDRARPERWAHSWGDLHQQVIDQDLCTGCSGCILACPRDVLTLDSGGWRPQLSSEAWVDGDALTCAYTARGCTMCTRACPRFGTWETDADLSVRGRTRTVEEVLGVHQGILLVKAVDTRIADRGQDGGLATAMLTFALENDVIDAALVSYFDEGQAVRPGVARTRAELLQAAGSRYTYSPTSLALAEAIDFDKNDRIGMVSVGCQTSIPAVAGQRGVRRLARRFALTIGLLCSVTFDESIYDGLILGDYGIERHDIRKVNIKGRLQLWTDSPFNEPPDLEIALKECGPLQPLPRLRSPARRHLAGRHREPPGHDPDDCAE